MGITHNHSCINARVGWPTFSREQFAIDVILGRSLWWVLGHEKFCLRLRLTVAKICALLWALFVTAFYTLYLYVDGRTKHTHTDILLKPYFVRVNSLTFVTDDCLCRVADIYDMMGWINWCSKWIDDRGIQISRILLLLVVDRTWKALQNYWTRTYPSWDIHGGKKHWLSYRRVSLAPLFPFLLMSNNSWLFLLLCLIHGLLYLSSLQVWTFANWNMFCN